MEEKKFKELLLENNKILMREMDKIIDHKIEKNNKVLTQQMENMIKKSEERQNGKLAYLEFTYGEKISAIFDKIQSIEDILKENEKYWKKVDRHDDVLYSHDIRISKLEDSISSV